MGGTAMSVERAEGVDALALDAAAAEAAPTPLVPVRLEEGAPAIWCKLEYLNPSGSTKDRIARFILGKALAEGAIEAGDAVVEASSGSTSIAMARVCALAGLRFVAVMPEGTSSERELMIRAYGGAVRWSPRGEGIGGALAAAERLGREGVAGCRRVFLPRQFHNPDNAEAHRVGTARETLAQLAGRRIDAFASGVGTGGTLAGFVRAFEDAGLATRPVLARPVCPSPGSATSSSSSGICREAECCAFSCRIPGVVECASAIFRPAEVRGLMTVEVSDEEAITTTRRLIRLGFPVGPSSGLNYCAAVAAARTLGCGMSEPLVLTVFPDRMERYFSTELFRPYGAGAK